MAAVRKKGFIMTWLVPNQKTAAHPRSSASREPLLSLPWPTRKTNCFPGEGVGIYADCSSYRRVRPSWCQVRLELGSDILQASLTVTSWNSPGWADLIIPFYNSFSIPRCAGFLVMLQCCEPALLLQPLLCIWLWRLLSGKSVIEAFYTSKSALTHTVLLTKMLCVVYSSEHCPWRLVLEE